MKVSYVTGAREVFDGKASRWDRVKAARCRRYTMMLYSAKYDWSDEEIRITKATAETMLTRGLSQWTIEK